MNEIVGHPKIKENYGNILLIYNIQVRHVQDIQIIFLTHNDSCHHYKMSRDVRKPVLGVADQVQHKTGCTATGLKFRI